MLYDNLFVKTCGSPGTGAACHSADGKQGGLVLADIDTAYDMLLGTDGGHARVVPGNPECSVLVERVESTDPAFRMPLNSDMPLSDGLRCAIRQWIQNGATRQ
jgi:hypothetical protein